jgi:hypothetical protein
LEVRQKSRRNSNRRVIFSKIVISHIRGDKSAEVSLP